MSNARNIANLNTVEVGATADQTKADVEGLGIAASSITGALPAISGASVTGLGGIIKHTASLTNTNKVVAGTQVTPLDTGLTLTVTPQSAKSTFLVMFSCNAHFNLETPNYGGGYTILKDTTIIDSCSCTGSGSLTMHVGMNIKTSTYVTHNSTSSFTVKVQATAYNTGGNHFYWHWDSGRVEQGPTIEIIEFEAGGQ